MNKKNSTIGLLIPIALFLLGACATLSFSPYNLFWIAPISITGLLTSTLNCLPHQAARRAFIWGLGLFITGIGWISICIEQFGHICTPISWLLTIILCSYLSLYPALFSLLLRRCFAQSDSIRLLITAPALWHVCESIRAKLLTGFPWLQFGYTQLSSPLKVLAPIGGVELITMAVMLISGLATLALSRRSWRPIVIVGILLICMFSMRKIRWVIPKVSCDLNIALIQGNITQDLKWNSDQLSATLHNYWYLTKPLLPLVDWIIWPETAIPTTAQKQQHFLRQISQQLLQYRNKYLITGIIDQNNSGNYFNSIALLGQNSHSKINKYIYYHKYHLVPFGEFLPNKKWLSHIISLLNVAIIDFTHGPERQPPLHVYNYWVTPTICYEIIFGEQVRNNFNSKVDCILTLSNDSWFGDTHGPWQHLQMAQMRALELGRPLIRSANTGVTAFIDHHGNIMAKLPQFTAGSLIQRITPTTGLTPYALWGNTIAWGISIICLMFSWLHRSTNTR